MTAKTTLTVTHADGTVSTRTTAADYRYAVEVSPADAATMLAIYRTAAAQYAAIGGDTAATIAARYTADADAIEAGTWGNEYSVIRWSARRDLAEKAIKENADWAAREGRTVRVVEVDAR